MEAEHPCRAARIYAGRRRRASYLLALAAKTEGAQNWKPRADVRNQAGRQAGTRSLRGLARQRPVARSPSSSPSATPNLDSCSSAVYIGAPVRAGRSRPTSNSSSSSSSSSRPQRRLLRSTVLSPSRTTGSPAAAEPSLQAQQGGSRRQMTLRLLDTERNHLLSPKPQNPRDAALSSLLRSPRVSCSCQSTSGSPKRKTTAKMAHGGGLERSLSFKNWEAAASRGGGGINGARPGTLALQQQQPSPRRVVSASPHPQAQAMIEYISPRPKVELDKAATKLQKVFKGARTRRNLADGAIIAEELWWKTVDSVSLKIKSISFFEDLEDKQEQETAASRWSRAGKRIAKVGKGLSKDDKAQKLALQHWLEAIDPRHRYGHNLHLYYDIWSASSSCEPFFYWLDVGNGRDLDLPKCPRNKLHSQLIMYLGPNERAAYEVVVEEGLLLYKQSGDLVNTNEESKWIFVLSTSRSLYVGQKRKGKFQHSSFLSGAATSAAGRLVAKEGVLKAIWPYSGHYLPTEENFREFINFLEDSSVDLANVKRCSVDDDEHPSFKKQAAEEAAPVAAVEAVEDEARPVVELPAVDIVKEEEDTATAAVAEEPPKMTMMASRPSFKWSTPTGARIGCLQNYPADVQSMALEQVNLSPRVAAVAPSPRLPIPSPRPSPEIRLSPSLHYMGCPTPTGARLPIPSPARRCSPKQQFMGFHTPAVALTLPKNRAK